MSIAEKLATIAENEQKVFDAGQQAEYDRFWDAYQEYGERRSYSNAFYTWRAGTFKPKYPIVCAESNAAISTFSYLYDTEIPVDVEITNPNPEYWANNANSTFYKADKVVTIKKLTVDSTVKFSNTFGYCNSLQNIILDGTIGQNGFDIHWSPLTHDSLMSILGVLADYAADTSGTSWVVTLGTDNLAKLTDQEKAIATEKGWTLA